MANALLDFTENCAAKAELYAYEFSPAYVMVSLIANRMEYSMENRKRFHEACRTVHYAAMDKRKAAS